MLRLISLKITRAAITLIACMSAAFFVLRLAGDPLDVLVSLEVPDSIREQYRSRWGLDLPLPEQWLHYIAAAFHGDFGRSLIDGRDAMAIVLERVPATLELGAVVLGMALIVGVPAGTFAALKRGSYLDRSVMSAAIFGYAMPNFFLGILLIILFALRLRVLPSSGYGGVEHMVLPALTLGAAMAGKLARFVRSSVLEVLGQPYVRTAKAKQLSPLRVITRHIFPNAAIPIVTFMGFEIGLLIGGAVVTESVFGWPGVGQLLVTSVARRDLAVVQCIVLLIAASMVVANTLTDLAYGWMDPRVRDAIGTSR